MSDLKHLERDTHNVHGLNEHGSYCECLWCLESETQHVGTTKLAERELEQAMTAMLRNLPLSVAIAKRGDLSNDEYTWQCMGNTGRAYSFVAAAREALQAMLEDFAVVRV